MTGATWRFCSATARRKLRSSCGLCYHSHPTHPATVSERHSGPGPVPQLSHVTFLTLQRCRDWGLTAKHTEAPSDLLQNQESTWNQLQDQAACPSSPRLPSLPLPSGATAAPTSGLPRPKGRRARSSRGSSPASQSGPTQKAFCMPSFAPGAVTDTLAPSPRAHPLHRRGNCRLREPQLVCQEPDLGPAVRGARSWPLTR